ncbi:MAG: UDP-N-acetylmuramate--L-alanine ligase [Lactobacillales bacterium]|jgi:UDP-N-acetylmuramate--alanine ligase|nr:UDP-N-acetylmuramate--L-alanine ligase [Lactobacillales bacterium]
MNKEKAYFFIGIKGSGMSALALILKQMEFQVAGSDIDKYFFTQHELDKVGISIVSFSKENIKPGMEIILGNSFKDTHEEVVRARELGLKVTRFHHFLGELISSYTSVGVAGAHGKTSTTGLLAHVFSGMVPTSYLIGDGTGVGNFNAKYFVFESDEYERHFLAYHPDYAIITNVDFDHPDYYHSLEDFCSAFEEMARQVKKGIIAYGEDPHLRRLEVGVPVFYYGVEENNDFVACNIHRSMQGSSFDAYFHDELIGHFSLPTYGHHNVMNALAVVAVAYQLGLDKKQISEEMATFSGVKRRFSEKRIGATILIDDFAHHPTEIAATLDAARQKYPKKEIAVVFQPHTFSRTIALLDDFAKSLDLADRIFLGDIYGSARESAGEVSIKDLQAEITRDVTVISEDDVSDLLSYKNEVIVFMGAGDIQKFESAYEDLLRQYQ